MNTIRLPRFLRSRSGIVGLLLCIPPLVIAAFGALINPTNPTQSLGIPGTVPSAEHLLGLDYLGRDVLARTLEGGASVIALGAAAAVLAYFGGFIVGVSAGYSRTSFDAVVMRIVDLILAFPALVVLLIAVTVFGTSPAVLLISVAFIQLPGIARLVRSTTQVARTSGYVESAEARGESPVRIVPKEILPNIAPIVLVDFGLRFGQSVLLVASMNFLGLGLQPPASDWGLMVAENRSIIAINPLSTLAPALLLMLLLVGINLLGDSFSASLGTSPPVLRKSRFRRWSTWTNNPVAIPSPPLATASTSRSTSETEVM